MNIAPKDRKTSSLITMLPLAQSKKVERMARQAAVSKAEIGRRAITLFLKETEKVVKETEETK